MHTQQLFLCIMLSVLVKRFSTIKVYVTFIEKGQKKHSYSLKVGFRIHILTLKNLIIDKSFPGKYEGYGNDLEIYLKRKNGNIQIDGDKTPLTNTHIEDESQLYAFWKSESTISHEYMKQKHPSQPPVNNQAGTSNDLALRTAQSPANNHAGPNIDLALRLAPSPANNEVGPSTEWALKPARPPVNNEAGPSTQRALRHGRPRINNRAGPSISFTVTFIVNGMDYHTYQENISSGSNFSTLKSHILKTCFPLYSDDLHKDLTVYLKGVHVCTEVAGIHSSLSSLKIVENSQLYAFWRVEYDMSYQYMLGQLQPQPPVNNEAGPSNDLTLRLAPPLVDDEAGPNINLTL